MDIDLIRARLALDPSTAPAEAIGVLATGDDAVGLVADPPTPAAVLVAIVHGDEPGILLTKRAATLTKHAGQIAFPADGSSRTTPRSRPPPCGKRSRRSACRHTRRRSWDACRTT